MANPSILLVRTPRGEVGGLAYGGPMRIRIGPRRAAYLGFASRALAEAACRHWSLPASRRIEPWAVAVRHDAAGERLRHVLIFRDEDDLRAWLRSPATFDVEAHLVPLHPEGPGAARRGRG